LKHFTSLTQIQNSLNSGELTCINLLDDSLNKIKLSKTNSFIEVFSDEAIKRAKIIDNKIKAKTSGKLAGMIIGIKDNICYKNHKISASSKILKGFESIYNSTVVEKLEKEDAIIIGRLNCDEFGMGSSNENSVYGNVLNPNDLSKVPGGSSGGSAAALAEGLCLATLGSDTGGSIRQPASFCGIVGLKPSYGRVSRYGLIAYASSFDQIGTFTNNVEDAALVLEVISGKDEFDSTSSSSKVENYSKKIEDKKYKFAILKEYINSKGLDPEIKQELLEYIKLLKDKGHIVEEVPFTYLDYLVPTYYVLTTAEASSNLSRYDGVHYGKRSKEANNVESTYIKSRSEGFGDEVKRRIMLGTFVLSAGYYDAYYTKALKVRRLIKERTEEIFKQYDFILTPTSPSTAFGIGEIKDNIAMYLQDIFTVHANLSGNPAISLPLGKHTNSLPFGIQLMSDNFKEHSLLSCADYIMNLKK
jgi:aspartyl-tRNA(Asn)/glutamyl-tRNA(Gln) amidotransferase subunit A